jgi:hypothetical protein
VQSGEARHYGKINRDGASLRAFLMLRSVVAVSGRGEKAIMIT